MISVNVCSELGTRNLADVLVGGVALAYVIEIIYIMSSLRINR